MKDYNWHKYKDYLLERPFTEYKTNPRYETLVEIIERYKKEKERYFEAKRRESAKWNKLMERWKEMDMFYKIRRNL